MSTELQRKKDFQFILEHKRLGYNSYEIADLLLKDRNYHVDVAYVNRVFNKYTNDATFSWDIEQERANAMADIDWIILQATSAFKKSVEVAEKKTVKQGPTDKKFKYIDKAKNAFTPMHTKLIEKLETAGDPKYLDIILKCVMAKARLVGVMDMKKSENTLKQLLQQLQIEDAEIEEGRMIAAPVFNDDEAIELDIKLTKQLLLEDGTDFE